MSAFATARPALAFASGAVAASLLVVWWPRRRLAKRVRELVHSLDGDPASAEGLIDRASPHALWRALLASPGPRWHRFQGLLVRKGLLARGEAALRHRNPARRVDAVQVLRSLSVPKSTSLCLVALHDAAPSVRLAAIQALSEHRGPKAVDALVEAIPSFSTEEREAAKAGLLDAGDELAAAVELSTAGAPEEARMWIADFLGAWRLGGAVRLLLCLAADRNPGVRAHAATNLSEFPAAAAVPVLVTLLSDGAWFVRVEAAKSLARVDGAGAVDPLSRVLTDPEWWVRKETAQALYSIGPEGRCALVRAVVGGEETAKEAALGALSDAPLETVIKAAWIAGAKEEGAAVVGHRRPDEVA